MFQMILLQVECESCQRPSNLHPIQHDIQLHLSSVQ